MEDKLIELLATIEPTVYRQGSLGEKEKYPKKFFTFWNNNSEGASHYDNTEASTLYDYDVNFYSTSSQLTYDTLRETIKLLKANGWIVSGDGYDIGSDEETHTGRGCRALYIKY